MKKLYEIQKERLGGAPNPGKTKKGANI